MAKELNHPGGYVMLPGLAGTIAENDAEITLDAKSEAIVAEAARSGKAVIFGKIDVGNNRYIRSGSPVLFEAFGDGDSIELIADVPVALLGIEAGAVTEYSHLSDWCAIVYSDDSVFMGIYEV